MNRVGKISAFDQSLGKGEIMDSNDQEISFAIENSSGRLTIGMEVCFQICLLKNGLEAVEVIALKDPGGLI